MSKYNPMLYEYWTTHFMLDRVRRLRMEMHGVYILTDEERKTIKDIMDAAEDRCIQKSEGIRVQMTEEQKADA